MRWTDARRSSSASSAIGCAAGGGGKRRGEPRCGFWGDASAVRGAVRCDDTEWVGAESREGCRAGGRDGEREGWDGEDG